MSLLNLKSPSLSAFCPLEFLEQNPSISESLLADCNYDLNEVTTIIEPMLRAPKRCQVTPVYIQAVVTDRTTFLATNLTDRQEMELTAHGSTWLIGRSSTCAINLCHSSISRCHAVIGYTPAAGFYITDLGSSNGTWVNCRKLASGERRQLQDGTLLRLGTLDVEFFWISHKQAEAVLHEITYC